MKGLVFAITLTLMMNPALAQEEIYSAPEFQKPVDVEAKKPDTPLENPAKPAAAQKRGVVVGDVKGYPKSNLPKEFTLRNFALLESTTSMTILPNPQQKSVLKTLNTGGVDPVKPDRSAGSVC